VRPAVVHLVRSPEGSVQSFRTRKPGLETRHTLLSGTVRWMTTNLASSAVLERCPGRCETVRYEDFVARPAESVGRIGALVGQPGWRLPGIDGHIALGENHSMLGNPDRFSREVRLQLDERWTESMSGLERAVVRSLTSPVRGRWGY